MTSIDFVCRVTEGHDVTYSWADCMLVISMHYLLRGLFWANWARIHRYTELSRGQHALKTHIVVLFSHRANIIANLLWASELHWITSSWFRSFTPDSALNNSASCDLGQPARNRFWLFFEFHDSSGDLRVKTLLRLTSTVRLAWWKVLWRWNICLILVKLSRLLL